MRQSRRATDDGRMQPALAALSLALCLPLVLAACAAPGRDAEAADLREELAALPGVAEVELDYLEPVPLDSGKVELRATLDRSATAEQVVAVVETAYAAFAGAHHDEEADLHLTVGDDRVHLRSFQPRAEAGAVGEPLWRLLADRDEGRLTVDLMTQWVERPPHVEVRADIDGCAHRRWLRGGCPRA